MTALVIILLITNAATVAVLFTLHRRRPRRTAPADPDVVAAYEATSAGSASGRGRTAARPRRFISIEVLNPIELAGTRNRVLGIAGSFVPHLTRRVVYDQIVKILRQQLVEQNVVAEVRVHVVQPQRPGEPALAVVEETETLGGGGGGEPMTDSA